MKKSKFNPKMTRRQVLKAGIIGGAGMMLPLRFLPAKAFANGVCTNGKACAALNAVGQVCTNNGLSDTCKQPKFENFVPNALDRSFVFQSLNNKYKIAMQPRVQTTGLVDTMNNPLMTTVWGYGENGPGGTWPGMTFIAQKDVPVEVKWENKLPNAHLLPVDTSLHWAYSLPGYEQYSIAANGVPAVAHLHGGHSDSIYDGNPEFFFSPGFTVRGPQWVDKKYVYQNDQPAGTLWYHDHALGITRINVYAGLAGFYILRDQYDTGLPGNALDLPAGPYEWALAIQDRMFLATGELFYPAFPGDPYYDGFINGEGAVLPPDIFPGGGPTALAEFFGDHMLVNGQIWPKINVEPRNYRLRFLNGCDSRFLVAQFFEVPAGATNFDSATGPLDFTVIGSDQGLASSPTTVNTLLMETGSRYDIIFDFDTVTSGNRVIMKNIGGDEPFGGDIPGPQIFNFTNRIMAFDVVLPLDAAVPDVSPTGISFGPDVPAPSRTRKVALFEGMDEFGRLQPLLGTAEPATDYAGNPINWPNTPVYVNAGLVGQMEGSIAWHSPTTENPALGATEEWEIWNVTGDAHPIHLHLVHFEILKYDEMNPGSGRQMINFDSAANDGFIPPNTDESLATELSDSSETQVTIQGAIPGFTPDSGTILVTDDDGNTRELKYSEWSMSTFTLAAPADFSSINASEGNNVRIPVAEDDGAYIVEQLVVQHNGVLGNGFRIVFPSDETDAYGAGVPQPAEYVENTRKDMVTALPGQITRIKATFDKPGRYVWHCHILSHEDHEMMRVLHVGPGA